MSTQILRIGKTLAVPIPEDVAAEAALGDGSTVSWIKNSHGGLELQRLHCPPVKEPITLDKMLESLAEQEPEAEIVWGNPRGAEAW